MILCNIRFLQSTCFIIMFLLILIPQSWGQEHEHESDQGQEKEQSDQEIHEFKNWRIGIGFGQSYLPAGDHTTDKVAILVIPTIGLDIQYWFNPKFGIALKNELEIISYVIDVDQENEIEREYPLITVLVAMYKLKKGPSFYLGAGIEYEQNKNFYIAKAGIEYELELGNHWDVTPEFYYFNKDGDFGGIGVAVTFGKRF